MLLKLTHPLPDYELWVDINEISCMERKFKPKTTLVTIDNTPEQTIIALKGGKHIACVETPQEIMELANKEYDKLTSELNME
jgi:carbon monoxide dehydrogenase subunit G